MFFVAINVENCLVAFTKMSKGTDNYASVSGNIACNNTHRAGGQAFPRKFSPGVDVQVRN
jgi:hypothetical protein